MTMPLLLEYFDDLLIAPENADHLNRAVLQLAVQGKLVEQNSDDGSAAELLANILREKERLSEEGMLFLDNDVPQIQDNEKLFSLPDTWEWVRTNDICEYIQRGKSPNYSEIEKYPVVSQKCIQWSGFDLSKARFIDPASITSYQAERFLQVGDLLWNSTGLGTLGRINICNKSVEQYEVVVADSHVTIVRPIKKYIDTKYLYLWFASPFIQNEIDNMATGSTKQTELNVAKIRKIVIPLPPLAEQQRIVARVEELFVQTRALAKELAHSQSELDGLNKSALSHLLASETPEEFNQHWEFIAEYFDLLFQAPEHVAPLRQSILELAVRGKLTRRDAGDESAGELLKRINKEKPLPPIEENEKPFDLPEGWEWVRLENIVSVLGDGLHGTPEYADDGEYFFVNGNNLSDGKIEIKKNTKRVSQSEYDKYKKELNSRTVFVSINGTIGNLAFYNNEKIILGKSACYFNLLDDVDKFYIGVLIKSPYFLEYVRLVASKTTISNVSLKSMRNLLIPLPPFAEQERIVKRVEQLLSLCDALEGRLQSAEDERGMLVAAVMSTVGGRDGE